VSETGSAIVRATTAIISSRPGALRPAKVVHSPTATNTIDAQDTLEFSVLQDVRPMIETLPLDKAPEAFARMMDGKARFRMVLVNGKD
jgi:D-arabinose 1-dehydrogenase-like Zn-dependent alcohol dehydrogenase